MSDAKSIAEALRVVVMTRLRCDRQTREERVNPVLMANRSIAPAPSSRPSASPEEIVREASEGQKLLSRMAAFAHIQPALKDRIDHRQNTLVEKTSQLREEYLLLHERWQAHCVKLDSKSTKKNKDVPVVAEEIPVIPASSGRSTRRTAAILGDAVRSDLEMEQIIASLGVEELTDPNHLALRNLAKIPDMISVTHGEVKYLFDDTNNIVDDPIRFYNTSANVESWTEEEREIFLEQFAANPKQFGIIASRLPAKTASQCVAYYYLHKKKHIDFRKIISQYAPGKRKRGGRRTDKQKGNALMADIRQHDDEVTLSHSGPTTRRKRRTVLSAVKPPLSRLGATQLEMTPTSTPTPDPEPEVRKRGRKPAVKIFADDMHDDNVAEPKPPVKRGRKAKKPPKTPALVPDEHPTLTAVDSTESTTKRKTTVTSAHWSDDDKSLFLHLLSQHGDDFKRIAASMPNKTTVQVSNYFKSNLVQLGLDNIVASAPKRSPTPEPPAAWKEAKQPANAITPSMVAVPSRPEPLSLPRAGLNLANEPTTYALPSGDSSGNSPSLRGLTDPTRQLLNLANRLMPPTYPFSPQPSFGLPSRGNQPPLVSRESIAQQPTFGLPP
ncbi:hypothetical protein FIBSPDRAFT_734796 [Athelia psychrophila]|uniref:SANT domain-containing protein n=1 Tax=Athelia psychrophila TaxID=1759441 RepID=A0A166NGV5_9AGAM|nr:hypothetical protein FIBSPDRAFT_734796 [Fibularhizoctonia sp. CBS 109695]